VPTGRRSPIEPHRYEANEAAARLFSPLGAEWDRPVELCAEQLYLGALRDGLLLLGLEPGQGIAAPGFCEVQFKPALLLAALAAGATWVELGPDELEDGHALFGGAVAVLGVSGPLRRKLASSRPPPAGRVTRWFKNLAEDTAVKAWTAFESRMKETRPGRASRAARASIGARASCASSASRTAPECRRSPTWGC
jgi:hypothetical protein